MTRSLALAELAEAVVDALADLADLQLQAPQDYLDRTRIKDEFLTRLLDLYLIQSAAVASRPVFDVAVLLGWFELQSFDADPAIFQVAHLRHIVHWDRVPTLFTDPSGLLRETYGWGTGAFDSAALVTNLGAVLQHVASDVRHRDLPAIPLSRIHGGDPRRRTAADPASSSRCWGRAGAPGRSACPSSALPPTAPVPPTAGSALRRTPPAHRRVCASPLLHGLAGPVGRRRPRRWHRARAAARHRP